MGGQPSLLLLGVAWPSPFLVVPPSPRGCGHPCLRYRVLWEELLVAAFEDVHLRIVEAGVVIDGSISLPDETAPGTNGSQSWACGRVDLREPVPCPLLGEPQKALLGQSGYWALKRLRDGREKERQGSRSVSRRQLQKRRPCYRAWTGKGKQNEEKLPTFKRYVQEAWTTLGEGERRGKERTSEHQKGQCH